jgi:hypothetical protein
MNIPKEFTDRLKDQENIIKNLERLLTGMIKVKDDYLSCLVDIQHDISSSPSYSNTTFANRIYTKITNTLNEERR